VGAALAHGWERERLPCAPPLLLRCW
jgi:hypothetical protein